MSKRKRVSGEAPPTGRAEHKLLLSFTFISCPFSFLILSFHLNWTLVLIRTVSCRSLEHLVPPASSRGGGGASVGQVDWSHRSDSGEETTTTTKNKSSTQFEETTLFLGGVFQLFVSRRRFFWMNVDEASDRWVCFFLWGNHLIRKRRRPQIQWSHGRFLKICPDWWWWWWWWTNLHLISFPSGLFYFWSFQTWSIETVWRSTFILTFFSFGLIRSKTLKCCLF